MADNDRKAQRFPTKSRLQKLMAFRPSTGCIAPSWESKATIEFEAANISSETQTIDVPSTVASARRLLEGLSLTICVGKSSTVSAVPYSATLSLRAMMWSTLWGPGPVVISQTNMITYMT